MDNQEAKFILRAYRPNGADATDVTFADALAQAKIDPQLGKWFERELALDRAVTTQLRGIAPPAGLRDAILTGGKVSRFEPAKSRSPIWFALAACLVLGAISAIGWPMVRARGDARFADYAMGDVLHGQHANHGEATTQLETYLENKDTRIVAADMPVSYHDLRSTGCRTLEFGGQAVAELCFQRSGHWFHLYVMPKLGGEHGPKFHEE